MWCGDEIAEQKTAELEKLKEAVRQPNGSSLSSILTTAKKNPVYGQHRLFPALQEGTSTATQEFVNELPVRVNAL